jgi:hypothetical protein
MESVAVLFLYETEHGDLFCHMTEELSTVGKRAYVLKCFINAVMSFSIKMIRMLMAATH